LPKGEKFVPSKERIGINAIDIILANVSVAKT
jgi:hypothetical protein